ncbi:HlyD family secretion protein [Terriglobus albidus]|uniref:HlyD family secretion protein n=1 Tax=Terriglobus albidus TaxID=1592106 RepID=A0A5B9EDP0_9BACT|nr:HlyD family secretion protein [Terriglobus albidus]QEE28880.1 HlyD family secretion protein [Terriglobus albidus]
MSKKLIIPLIVLLAAAGLLFAIAGHWTEWEGQHAEQQTDDAYLRADMTPLSTRISGTVRKVNVGDYQIVKSGQTLMELDDNDYRANLDQAKAALAASEASLADNQAAKRIQDAQINAAEAGTLQASAAIDSAKAGIAAVAPEAERALTELHRQEALFGVKAATHQQLENVTAQEGQIRGSLDARKADLARAQAALATSQSQLEAAKRQREALNTKDNVYKADIQAKKAAIVVAEVNLAYTRIAAPTDGTVGERRVLEGQLVTPGTQVIDLVKSDVWVQANFKETQLTNMRVGAPVEVRVDTFPNQVFHGKVAELSPASGSQFALLPPDNATGNFTKIVQRVPVKVVLDAGQPYLGRLRPGFSAVVTVKTKAAEGGR